MNKLELIKAILDSDYDETRPVSNNGSFWKIGSDYVVRTVTMIYLGKLKDLNKDELLLEDCAWIPDTSRWNEFLNGTKPCEMEPYPYNVIIGRGAILDATEHRSKMKREVL